MKYPYTHPPQESVSDAIDAAMVTVANSDPLGYSDTAKRIMESLKTAKMLLEGPERKRQLRFAWEKNDAMAKTNKELRDKIVELKEKLR